MCQTFYPSKRAKLADAALHNNDVFCLSFFSFPTSPLDLAERTDSPMAPNDNFIQRAVNDTVAGAGSYAGGIVDSAGKTVSGAGRNVGNRY